ncbi:MAG: tetratricopeptide repeat protein [bacterium]|nr:tetratricopeptide repeat protein [bacterium]
MKLNIRTQAVVLLTLLFIFTTIPDSMAGTDEDIIKGLLEPGERLTGYRKVDVNRDELDDFIVHSRKAGQPLATEYLRVFQSQPDSTSWQRKLLMEEQNLSCSDFDFIPGPKVLSAIVSTWTAGGEGARMPNVFFVLGNKFVRFTGFQRVGTQEFSIVRDAGQVFLTAQNPIFYHKCGLPFSLRTIYYGFKGNLFYRVKEITNQPANQGETINLAAYYFIQENYRKAASIYHQVHETFVITDDISDDTIDLVVEALFYQAKSLELGGQAGQASETYRRLVGLYPEHWMSEAARGELKAIGGR